MDNFRFDPIVWIGRFAGFSGFANSTRNYFKALLKFIPELKLASFEALEPEHPLYDYRAELPLPDGAFRILNHQPRWDPEAEAYLSVWEYDRIPDSWAEIFNREDCYVVMTQSNFCARIFAEKMDNPSKIYVVPYIPDDCFRPEGERLRYFPEDYFVFGSVFEWVPRKVPERLLEAFKSEFSPNEKVALVMKISLPRPSLRSTVEKLTDHPNIKVIFDRIPDISRFYRGLDAYISCTGGEGFGQTLLEAMLCGIPTIGSAYSGNTDFMNDRNSFLVEVERPRPVPDNPEFMYRPPRIDAMRRIMRYLADHGRDDPKILEKIENAVKLRSKYTPQIIGKKIFDILYPILTDT